MTHTLNRADLTRAAAIFARLRRGDTLTAAQLGEELGIKRHAVARALKPLVDPTLAPGYAARPGFPPLALVLSEAVYSVATQTHPPGSTCHSTACADAEWPDWLPAADEEPKTAAHGPIVASALLWAVPSVWALGRACGVPVDAGRVAA